MLRAVIDSNAVDHLPAYYDAVVGAINTGDLELLWTHVTVDELAAIPNEGHRATLLCLGASVCRFVPTGACVADFSRFDMSRLNDDVEAFEAHRAGNLRHTRDALVAITAVMEEAVVVTYDAPMRNRAASRGLNAYDWPSLMATLVP